MIGHPKLLRSCDLDVEGIVERNNASQQILKKAIETIKEYETTIAILKQMIDTQYKEIETLKKFGEEDKKVISKLLQETLK